MGTDPSIQPDSNTQLGPNAQGREPNWRAAISGQQLAFAWALAAFLGGISISVAPRDTLIRLVLPVAIMLIYVWISYPRDSAGGAGLSATRIAQLADSAYFLGFLWTLWALIDSFVLKASTSAETAFRVFGYALVTTAAGMGIRLYLLQFKYGATDQAAEAEFSVERNLQIFSESMQNASQSIQSFHKYVEALNQHVDKLSTTLTSLDHQFVETHNQTTKAIRDNIAKVVEDIRTALKSPVQEYGRAIRAFTANVDQQSQLFTDIMQKSSKDVNQAVRDAIETAHKLIQATGERMASDHLDIAERLRGQVARIVEELHSLSVRMASIDVPTDALKKAADSFNELERALLAVAGLLRPDGQLRVNLVRFGEEVEARTDTVARALSSIATRLNSIKVPPEVVIDVADLTRALEELQKTVEGLLQKASDQRWQTGPQNASDAIVKLTVAVTNLRQTVHSADESVKKTLSVADGRGARRFPRNLLPW